MRSLGRGVTARDARFYAWRRTWHRRRRSARPSTAATPPGSSRRAGAPAASSATPSARARRRRGSRFGAPGPLLEAPDLAQRGQPLADRGRHLRRGAGPVPRTRSRPRRSALGGFLLILYIPMSYYTDLWLYRRRQRKEAEAGARRTGTDAVDIRMFTVGPVQENAYLLRRDKESRQRRDRRSRRGGRQAARGDRRARRRARRDPADAHALRPRRRGRAARAGDRRAGLLPGARDPRARRHHGLRAVGGLRPVRELGRGGDRRGRRDACRSRASTSTSSSRPGTAPATSPTPSSATTSTPTCRSCSPPATSSSRARSGAPTCPAATTRRCWPRSPAWPAASTTTRWCCPGHMGVTDARSRARDQPVPPGPAGALVSERLQAPRGTFDVLPEQAALRHAVERGRAADPRGARATGGSRRRPSRRPSSSAAPSASRRTSSRRRCTRSRTAAGAR